MEVIRGLHNLHDRHRGCAITIGNFDGLHLGHQKLLSQLKTDAKQRNVPTMVITFDPQPNEFFRHNGDVARLMRLREKLEGFIASEIDYVLCLRFDQALANVSAQKFLSDILLQQLKPNHVVIGDDFRFGAKRQGDYAMLKTFADEHNFDVAQMPTFKMDDERVSSTRVRIALEAGDLQQVERLLGQHFSLSGRVSHGDKLGRKIGFPTANIFLHRVAVPIGGVFVVTVDGLGPKSIQGAANVGTRPTVGGTECLLEVFLFDFNRDIYGQHVVVNFLKRLRDEENFESVEIMRQQIEKDVADAKEFFKKNDTLSLS